MSVLQANNFLLYGAFAQYTGSGTNTANTTVVQTQYQLNNSSLSGAPVTIDSSGNISFRAPGMHHVSITTTETSTTGNTYIPQILNVTDGGTLLIYNRFQNGGTFSSDLMVDATKKYNFSIYAAGSAISVKYTITLRRIGTL